MSWSSSDLLALKDEITNDPAGLGLVADAANDTANAQKLNEQRVDIEARRRFMGTAEILNAIAPLEHQALTPQQARYLDSVLTLQQVDPFQQSRLVDGVIDMFLPVVSESRTELQTAVTATQSSRIEQMFQQGLLSRSAPVTGSDIANARQAT